MRSERQRGLHRSTRTRVDRCKPQPRGARNTHPSALRAVAGGCDRSEYGSIATARALRFREEDFRQRRIPENSPVRFTAAPRHAIEARSMSPSETPWGKRDSLKAYNVRRWGIKYFDVNNQGNVTVSPLKDKGGAVEIVHVVKEAERRGLRLPLEIGRAS